MKIYRLEFDYSFSSFIEDYPEGQISVMNQATWQNWKPFPDSFRPVKLELRRSSDTGVKNYQFDFSASLRPFLVFSEHAFEKLKDILLPRGQVLPVITESKRKKFLGYYPVNPLKGCLDMEKSKYKEYEKGLSVSNPVLMRGAITDEYFFSVEETTRYIFVTSKFRERVEEHNLLGFDFSQEVELS